MEAFAHHTARRSVIPSYRHHHAIHIIAIWRLVASPCRVATVSRSSGNPAPGHMLSAIAGIRLTALARLLFAEPEMLLWVTDAPNDSSGGFAEFQFHHPATLDGPLGLTLPASTVPYLGNATTIPLIESTGRQIGLLRLWSPKPGQPSGIPILEMDRFNALAGVVAELCQVELALQRASAALAEKDLLAREADHRVANGLQLLHSALVLQTKAADDTPCRAPLQAAAQRVGAVARAHRQLHSLPNALGTACGGVMEYLTALLYDLVPVPLSPDDVVAGRAVEFIAEEGVAAAIPVSLLPRLGLIATELVTNALKHGAGRVIVELRRTALPEQADILLAVSDEGPGFPRALRPTGATDQASACGSSPRCLDRVASGSIRSTAVASSFAWLTRRTEV